MHQDSRETLALVDAQHVPTGVTLPEPDPVQGPRRKSPPYYIGESYGRYRTVHADVERNPNGSLPGVRNKAARRLIRKAFGKNHSLVETRIRNARALKAQAVEVISEDKQYRGRSRHAKAKIAKKLLAMELAIHTPVYAPDKKTLRKMRTEARRAKRRGEVDAITALADKYSGK